MGLLYLIRRPEIDNRIYEGHRMKSSQSSTEELIITDVGKKIKSLSFHLEDELLTLKIKPGT